MAGVQDQLEIKFRLSDGSDIGPKSFPAATSVSTLKESILAQWPKEKENGPRTVKDVKLISAGKILENNRTVGECRSPIYRIIREVYLVAPPPVGQLLCWLSGCKAKRPLRQFRLFKSRAERLCFTICSCFDVLFYSLFITPRSQDQSILAQSYCEFISNYTTHPGVLRIWPSHRPSHWARPHPGEMDGEMAGCAE
ncbi:hypothetical protein ACLB2K_058099 [Fragaria x ananassa]